LAFPAVDDAKDHSEMYTRPEHAKPSSPNRGGAGDERPSPFMSGGPGGTGGGGASPVVTKALTIPRTSVAHILLRESSLSTPRSQLDMPSSASLPTPSHSLTAADEPGSPKSPKSPKSPTTPGGRRRRQQKIHGMDYYEFCELVRAGSL